MDPRSDAEAADVVLFCADLHAALPFFIDHLGFRLDSIFPADDPSVATLSRGGLRIRLERGAASPLPVLPPSLETTSLVVTRMSGDAPWVEGRAGMRYRDLIPDRQAGRFIASHIQIPDAGPVADYVHFHEIRFQMIYCHRGWVRVVYEEQGPPFVLHPGDCVLQPPGIRHRVLEAAAGTEVIEVSSPAQHVTYVEHEMQLPTATERRDRLFGGQRFVRHEAASAVWERGRRAGFESRDTGIGQATRGLADVHVMRRRRAEATTGWSHDGELLFVFVLSGGATLRGEGRAEERLVEGDSCVVPAGVEHTWTGRDEGVELLEVVVSRPAASGTRELLTPTD